jgi:hypothetical protein
MTVSYKVTNPQTQKEVINAWTKHCFTNNNLRPINMKKADPNIHKIFDELYQAK